MHLIDVHSHVNFVAYDEDREDVLKRAINADVGMINVGTQQDTSKAAVDLAHTITDTHGGKGWAAIGLHPIHTSRSHHDTKELGEGGKEFTSRGEEFDYDYYLELGRDPLVVAIGECGLDYYRLDEETEKLQRDGFIKQIELANELNKPLMLHVRNGRGMGGGKAYEDVIELLDAHAKVRGDVHFFAGDIETTKKFLDRGFTMSFTGVVTFTTDYDEVVKYIPNDMLLSETDSPYITPIPHRGTRNEPIYVEYGVRRMAEIKGLSYDEMAAQTVSNAKRVFGLNV